jgi:hypothetical protein
VAGAMKPGTSEVCPSQRAMGIYRKHCEQAATARAEPEAFADGQSTWRARRGRRKRGVGQGWALSQVINLTTSLLGAFCVSRNKRPGGVLDEGREECFPQAMNWDAWVQFLLLHVSRRSLRKRVISAEDLDRCGCHVHAMGTGMA